MSEKLKVLQGKRKFVSVGLDTDYLKIPEFFRKRYATESEAIFAYNQKIIDSTKDIAGVYKINYAFYEGYGSQGVFALEQTIKYIKAVAPEVFIILDFKRGDIGNTNNGSVKFALDCGVDAITIAPYMGMVANLPFLEQKGLFVFVLGVTSNDGSGEMQNLVLKNKKYLYEQVIENVFTNWNTNGNCGVVLGATYPEKLAAERIKYPEGMFLIPGVGAQGAPLEPTLTAGFTKRGDGIIVNSSRGIIFASSGENFAEVAREETKKLHNAIVAHREKMFATV